MENGRRSTSSPTRAHTSIWISYQCYHTQDIGIGNDFYGKSDTPTRNNITIKANYPLLQTYRDVRNVTLAVYSQYIEVCTCDGQRYSSYSETQRRHLEFRNGSTKRKKWCVNDCQGRVYFTSDQIVYLPDVRFSAPSSWAGDEAVEQLAHRMLAFARSRPEKNNCSFKKI